VRSTASLAATACRHSGGWVSRRAAPEAPAAGRGAGGRETRGAARGEQWGATVGACWTCKPGDWQPSTAAAATGGAPTHARRLLADQFIWVAVGASNPVIIIRQPSGVATCPCCRRRCGAAAGLPPRCRSGRCRRCWRLLASRRQLPTRRAFTLHYQGCRDAPAEQKTAPCMPSDGSTRVLTVWGIEEASNSRSRHSNCKHQQSIGSTSTSGQAAHRSKSSSSCSP
jgi:hypothetical protein